MSESRLPESHPCVLVDLIVEKLQLEVLPNINRAVVEAPESFDLGRGHGVSEEGNQVEIGAKVVIGSLEKNGFRCEVWLRSLFEIDYTRFRREDIDHWATYNAPLVLYPFLRENVYALTSRAGLHRVFLPLLTVPSFRPQKEEAKVETSMEPSPPASFG